MIRWNLKITQLTRTIIWTIHLHDFGFKMLHPLKQPNAPEKIRRNPQKRKNVVFQLTLIFRFLGNPWSMINSWGPQPCWFGGEGYPRWIFPSAFPSLLPTQPLQQIPPRYYPAKPRETTSLLVGWGGWLDHRNLPQSGPPSHQRRK